MWLAIFSPNRFSSVGLPHDYDRVAPVATLMTGGVANGLYTLAGAILTLGTDSLRGWLRAMAWTIWAAGAALTICAVAGSAVGIAIATTLLFALFCPWVIMLARHLQTTHPDSTR